MAGVAIYLASRAGAYVTGAVIPVDGGIVDDEVAQPTRSGGTHEALHVRARRRARVGVVVEEEVVDLAAAAPELPREMVRAARGRRRWRCARAASAAARAKAALPLDAVRAARAGPAPAEVPRDRAQLRRPRRRVGLETPKLPTVFNKQSTCVTGPRDPIHLPRVSTQLDYEGELGFVIGRRCRHVPRARAHEVIAGYLIVNDVTVRDWQLRVADRDDGQVVRHARPDRAVARHGRRDRRPARPAAAHLGERRAAPGLEHQAPDLRLLRAGRAPLDRVHARARRRHRHRHARRRRRRR